MTKLKSLVRLDVMTVKPNFTVKNLLFYGAIVLFLTVVSGNISAGIGAGMMLGTMFASYPFVVGEKNNMDALYAMLAVSRKTVVAGRYLFTLMLDLCAILAVLVLSSFGRFAAITLGFATESGNVLGVVIVLSALFIMIQAIQLPIFFKVGYMKAKFFNLVLFVALISGNVAILGAANKSSVVSEFLTSFVAAIWSNGTIFVFVVVTVMCLIVLISYTLSLAFYKKREF